MGKKDIKEEKVEKVVDSHNKDFKEGVDSHDSKFKEGVKSHGE